LPSSSGCLISAAEHIPYCRHVDRPVCVRAHGAFATSAKGR
jgi:hypothetical protein